MNYHSTQTSDYFQSQYQAIAIHVDEDMSIIDVCKALIDEMNGMEYSEEESAELDGYIAWLMSHDDLDGTFIACPEHEDDPDDMDMPMMAWFVFDGERQEHWLQGVQSWQWIDSSQELPDAISEEELVIGRFQNWGSHHLTNTSGVMVRPFTLMGEYDKSYLIAWIS